MTVYKSSFGITLAKWVDWCRALLPQIAKKDFSPDTRRGTSKGDSRHNDSIRHLS